MAIPFLDLKAQYASIKPEIDAAVMGVLESCGFIGGNGGRLDAAAHFASQFRDFRRCDAAR